jgi:hypothetical protein
MSRPVAPRQTGAGNGAAPIQDWRTPWKRWAVEQLPATAPHAVRVEVRAAVDRALARIPPTTDEGEIRDLVLLVLDGAHERLKGDAERKARQAQKTALVAGAGLLLGIALRKLSSRAAQRMLRRPGYSLQRLEYRLIRHLQHHVTGEETRSDVQARVDAWVEARLAEQPSTPSISKGALVAGAVTGVALGFGAAQHPAVREVTANSMKKSWEVIERSGEVISKFLAPPSSSPTG